MNFVKKHKHGLLATLLLHGVAIVLLFLFGFTTSLPLPEEEGILLDFGGAGSGTTNPGSSSPGTSNAQHNVSSHNTPHTGNLTQDSEEAPALPSSNNATSNEVTSDANENVQEEPVFNNPIKNFAGSLSGGGTGTGDEGTGTGHPGFGGDGSTPGQGGGPGGIGGDLGGRKLTAYAEPDNKDNLFGEVQLKITVDESGNIREVFVVSSNCTECNRYAIEAVRKWKYESSPGSGLQTTVVTIKFKQQ
jgi:TonB family protein